MAAVGCAPGRYPVSDETGENKANSAMRASAIAVVQTMAAAYFGAAGAVFAAGLGPTAELALSRAIELYA
jgi:hypothetical protein